MVNSESGADHVPAVIVSDVSVTYSLVRDREPRNLKAAVAHAIRHQHQPTKKLTAVHGVSFNLMSGQALGLIGANGAGKSTLLRAMAGLVPVSSGQILARSEPVLLGVGAALHPSLSGRRNIFLGGTALGLSRAQVAARFDDIVDFAGVRDHIDFPLRTYSSGMAARLRFSIASAVEPDILLIDEALAVGDADFQRRSGRRLRQLIDRAGAFVLVSHSLASIQEMCRRVVWLHDGRIRHDGPTDEVLAAYRAFNE